VSSSSVRFTTRHVRAALDLYSSGLSCRSVAGKLAEMFDPAPSHAWVADLVAREGISRSKSRAMQLREMRRRGKNYDAIRPLAYALAREKQWSPRQIADELGVSRRFAQDVCRSVRSQRDEDLGDYASLHSHRPGQRGRVARGVLRRAWLADTPDAAARRERLRRVLELRLEGKTYREIGALVGIPSGSIAHLLHRGGLTLDGRHGSTIGAANE